MASNKGPGNRLRRSEWNVLIATARPLRVSLYSLTVPSRPLPSSRMNIYCASISSLEGPVQLRSRSSGSIRGDDQFGCLVEIQKSVGVVFKSSGEGKKGKNSSASKNSNIIGKERFIRRRRQKAGYRAITILGDPDINVGRS